MSEQTAFALWLTSQQAVELRQETLAEPGPDDVLVETLFSAVSRGTESLVFHGAVPKTEWQRMRAPHQTGNFPWPVKYGYSSVGKVVQGPSELVNKPVFCLYPHQDRYVVAARQVLPVPPEVPAERAVLAANLETALNALWDAPVLIGDRVSVVGAGVVGCLLAFLAAKQAAVRVELVDTNPARRKVAEALGAHFVAPEAASPERDVVFHASASQAGLTTALGLCGSESQVVELSWYGERAVSVELGAAFHVKRLSLRASQVGRVSPRARPRYGYRERLALALDLCGDPSLDVLFEPDVPFSELPTRLPAILAPESGALCQRVRYP